MKRTFQAGAVAAISAIVIGTAFAATPKENDALAAATSRISPTQAIAAAEQHFSGRVLASSADAEDEGGHEIKD